MVSKSKMWKRMRGKGIEKNKKFQTKQMDSNKY
jgi:hypothetical protein